jgi:hypothetical protein
LADAADIDQIGLARQDVSAHFPPQPQEFLKLIIGTGLGDLRLGDEIREAFAVG